MMKQATFNAREWARNKIGALLCLLFVMSIINATHAAPDRPKHIKQGDVEHATTYLSQFIIDLMDEEDLVGLSIAIVDNQRIVWQQGFGWADQEKKRPANAQTIYRTGSVSTLLTTSAILQLVEQGKIKLDTPIAKYLPHFTIQYHQPPSAPITPKNLLTHHSGLPISQFKGMWSEQPDNMAKLVTSLSQEYAAYSPNYIYAYSNTGFSVLGHLIESITKTDFATYLQKTLLAPLAMQDSAFVPTTHIQSKLAIGYKDEKPQQQLPARDIAALGLYSNVIDLAHFVQMIFNQGRYQNNTILAPHLVQQMFQNQRPKNSLETDRSIGFGWLLKNTPLPNSGQVAVRYGATLFFRGRINLLPKHQLGIIILTNSSNSFKAIDTLANEALAIALHTKTGATLPASIDADEPESPLPPPPATAHTQFAPSYVTRAGLAYVQADEDTFKANLLGRQFILSPTAKWFSVQYKLLGFIPIDLSWLTSANIVPATINNRDVIIARYRHNNYLLGVATSPANISPQWQQRVGHYIITNPDSALDAFEIEGGELRQVGNRLVFVYRLPFWLPIHIQIPLTPLTPKLARVAGLGTALNETLHVIGAGKNERLRYSGYELVRVEQEDDMEF